MNYERELTLLWERKPPLFQREVELLYDLRLSRHPRGTYGIDRTKGNGQEGAELECQLEVFDAGSVVRIVLPWVRGRRV